MEIIAHLSIGVDVLLHVIIYVNAQIEVQRYCVLKTVIQSTYKM